jgi:hypothetical protein
MDPFAGLVHSTGDDIASFPAMIRRRPLIGGLAAAAFAPAAAAAQSSRVADAFQTGSVLQAASRQTLARLDAAVGQAVLLTEPGREGLFVLHHGPVRLRDPLQGLSVPGRDGDHHWARIWDGVQGHPEWFGARTDAPAAASTNRAALQACVELCPVTLLAAATYHIDGTFRVQVSNRVVRGCVQSIEPPWDHGSQILCSDPRQDVFLIGGNDPAQRPAIIRVEEVKAGWSARLVPPPSGRPEQAPVAFRVQHVLAAYLHRCFALDPLVGFSFSGTVNTRCIGYGVTRLARFGGADFLRGVWVHGTPRYFAGGNASLYLSDGLVALAAELQPVLERPTGIFADADFADLYVNGLECAFVAFPIVLDGAGAGYSGGNGDVHIRNVVLDQLIGDGITIRNINALAKIQIDGGYIQVVDSGARNKGLWFENGKGQITVSNLQITGEDRSSTSIGIYLRNQPNVAISDSVIVENIAFPVTTDKGCPRLSLSCTINAGNLRGRGHAAVTLDGASQSSLRLKVTGERGAWSAGVELLGAGHDRVSIDPTMIDPASVGPGRKVVINGQPITSGGHYAAAGARAPEGAGVNVTGIVG